MNLCYTVDNKQTASIKYMGLEVKELISNQFQGIMNDAAYIFKHIFKESYISVDFVSKDEFYELVAKINLVVKTSVGVFNLVLENNRFRISNDDCVLEYEVQPFWPNDDIILLEYVKNEKNKIIVERFLNHKMEIEVHFKNTGKVFYVELPIETVFFMEPRYLNCLNEKMNINDLVSFYRRKLMKYQKKPFDIAQCDTIMSIWQKTDEYSNYNKKGFKLDEVFLRNGFIFDCQLGSINFDEEKNPIIIVFKNGTYTIMGYDCKNDNSLDLNQEVLLLEKRKRELN